MKLAILILACLASLGPPSIAAQSEPPGSLQWSGGAILATDGIFHGQSLTADKPSISGEIKANLYSGAYAGIWAANIDLGPKTDTHAEIDYFIGRARKFGKLYINTGYLYRQRPSSTLSLNYQDVTVLVSYDFGIARLGAGTYYSWDYFQGGRSIYRYANLRVPIAKPHGVQLSAIATAGHNDFSNRTIGNYSNIYLRLVAQHGSWEYSVGYSDTNIDPLRSGLLTRNESGPRWQAEVLVGF